MKNLFLATIFLSLSGYVFAQAKDGTAELNKTSYAQPAASIYLPYSPNIIGKAIDNFIFDEGRKENRSSANYTASSKTDLVKNHLSTADMHLAYGLRDPKNSNESVVYLKLNAINQGFYDQQNEDLNYPMQEAIDYLNNFAIAIKDYAYKLQVNWQEKNLNKAEAKSKALSSKGSKLEAKRISIDNQLSVNGSFHREAVLARKKLAIKTKANENLLAQAKQKAEVINQITSLSQLKNQK